MGSTEQNFGPLVSLWDLVGLAPRGAAGSPVTGSDLRFWKLGTDLVLRLVREAEGKWVEQSIGWGTSCLAAAPVGQGWGCS